MKYRILGPLEICVNETRLPITRRRERRALAALLLDANRSVSSARLTEVLWDEAPPPTAAAQIRNVMTALRQHLGGSEPSPIRRTGAGFVLDVAPGQLDLHEFERSARFADRHLHEGNWLAATAALREALALWRGAALEGIQSALLDVRAHQLEERRLACLEQRIEIDLAIGRHRDVVAEVAGLVKQYPLRERLAELLMIALHACGRRPEALAVFATARVNLAEQVGLDPRPELMALQRAILCGDPIDHKGTVVDVSTNGAADRDFDRLRQLNEQLVRALLAIRSVVSEAVASGLLLEGRAGRPGGRSRATFIPEGAGPINPQVGDGCERFTSFPA